MISQVIVFAAIASLAAAHGTFNHGGYAPQPYNFGYNVRDAHSQQFRQEQGDGAGNVQGSYGFTDARGIRRHVNYVADHGGFRAQVRTNEPGTANQNPAAVEVISDAHYAGGYGGLGDGRLGFGGSIGYGPVGLGSGHGGYGLGAGFLGGVGYPRYAR